MNDITLCYFTSHQKGTTYSYVPNYVSENWTNLLEQVPLKVWTRSFLTLNDVNIIIGI